MCQQTGMVYFEMSHLFTQWGAIAAPKVMATVDGEYQQIFGWDTPPVGGEYTRFLHIFLPQLKEKLVALGIADQTWFHISDEPQLKQLDSYQAARESVAEQLEGFRVVDALSDYEFYKTGLVPKPVPANNHIGEFLEHKVENLWTYYCTGQGKDVSNRFIAMPSPRNRIIGTQLYKYNIEGFLQWGFNFYNSFHSLEPVNPYQVTDCGGTFQAGDAYLVYPGKDGIPEESIRQAVFYHAVTDLRALKYLESLTSKDFVMGLLEDDLPEPITFFTYPTSAEYLLSLRNKVNLLIAEAIS